MGGLYLGGKLVTPVIEKEVAKTKFGATIDNLLGDVNENGVYANPQENFTIDLSTIKLVYPQGPFDEFFYACFTYNKALTGTIDISNFEGSNNPLIGYVSIFDSAFSNTNINNVIMPQKTNEYTGRVSLTNTFEGCTLTSVTLAGGSYVDNKFYLNRTFLDCEISSISGIENITEIEKDAFVNTFQEAKLPSEWHFDSLTTVNSGGLNRTFYFATGIQKLYFPALVNVVAGSFGTSSSNQSFGSSTITEIHFRADMQATIEAMSRYSSKFGATNATIYFSL